MRSFKSISILLCLIAANSFAQTNGDKKIYEIKSDFQGISYNLTYNVSSFFYSDSLFTPETYLEYDNEYNYFETKQKLNIETFSEYNPKFLKINTDSAIKFFKNQEKIRNKSLSELYFTDKRKTQYHYFGETSNQGDYAYKGSKKGKVPHGYGILIIYDEAKDDPEHKIYEGEFVYTKPEGFGILFIGNEFNAENQVSVIGNFTSELREGALIKLWKSDSWLKDMQINGFAKKVWNDGLSIQGTWSKNKINFGEVTIPKAGKYVGPLSYEHPSFASDYRGQLSKRNIGRDGEATFYYNNGDTLAGRFQDGRLTGKGVYKNKKVIYEGEFLENTFNGQGKMNIYNVVTYIGTWTKNDKNGEFLEISPDGTKIKTYWRNDKKVAGENDAMFSKLSSMPKILRDLYMVNNGNFYSNLKKSFIAGSGNSTSFSGNLLPDTDGLYVCNVSATAGGNRYSTNNCVTLETFEVRGNNIGLLFTGTISKIKDNSTIKLVKQPNGKYERKIVSDGQSYETMKLSLNIISDLQGNLKSYTLCFMNDSGRQDCGLGTYSGNMK